MLAKFRSYMFTKPALTSAFVQIMHVCDAILLKLSELRILARLLAMTEQGLNQWDMLRF